MTQDCTFRDRSVLQSTSRTVAFQPGLPREGESADEERVVGCAMTQRGVKKADLRLYKALGKGMIICRNQNSPTLIQLFLRKLVKCSDFLIELRILKSLFWMKLLLLLFLFGQKFGIEVPTNAHYRHLFVLLSL